MLIVLLVLALSIAVVVAVLVDQRASQRERRFRAVVDQFPGAIVSVFDHDLRVKMLAGPALTEGGIDPETMIGRRIGEIFDGELGRTLAAHYRAAIDGESRSFEFSSPHSARQIWLKVAPLREHGTIVAGLAVGQDVTPRHQAERDRAAEAGRRRLIIESMNEAYVAADAGGVITDWNRAAEATFGWTPEEAIGRTVPELILPERDHRDFWALLERRLPGQPGEGRFDVRADRAAIHRDGSEFTVELAATLVDIDGQTTLQTLMHDISDRKREERELLRHASDAEALSDVIGELSRSTTAAEARMAICTGATRVAAAEVGILFEPDPSGRGLRATASEGTEVRGELLSFVDPSATVTAFSTRDPRFVADLLAEPGVDRSFVERIGVSSALFLPVNREDKALGVVSIGWRDPVDRLSERLEGVLGVLSAEAAVAIERAELLDRLERMVRTDDLTGLPNRRAWDQELDRELARAGRDDGPLSVAMLDLDRFKEYNDRLGHQAGDRFLKEAAGAWAGVLRETDMLARYGGEEFAVALPGCDEGLAERLVERLREVTPRDESCSAGLATWDGSESADELLGRADRALYEAKKRGRDRTVIG